MIIKFSISLLDFFLPRFCPACKSKLLPEEKFICYECISKVQTASSGRIQSEFERKFLNDKIIAGFTSYFVFEKDKELQHIMHSIKYENKFLIGKHLGRISANNIRDKAGSWGIDLIIPIPLHSIKKFERGYNQSYFIARGIGKELKIKVDERAVKRKKYTESQTTMTLSERKNNIENAFQLRKIKTVKGKRILLVDDIITTGATTSECGKILLAAGAEKVYAASIAIAD